MRRTDPTPWRLTELGSTVLVGVVILGVLAFLGFFSGWVGP